jgi:hypothetical protein
MDNLQDILKRRNEILLESCLEREGAGTIPNKYCLFIKTDKREYYIAREMLWQFGVLFILHEIKRMGIEIKFWHGEWRHVPLGNKLKKFPEKK